MLLSGERRMTCLLDFTGSRGSGMIWATGFHFAKFESAFYTLFTDEEALCSHFPSTRRRTYIFRYYFTR